MEELIKNLGAFWGPAGVICALQFGAIVYLYRRVEAVQKEHVETLKIVAPLAQKFTQTMDMVMPIVMSKINDGGGR